MKRRVKTRQMRRKRSKIDMVGNDTDADDADDADTDPFLTKSNAETTSLLANNADLKAQIQEKVFAIAALKNDLRKFKSVLLLRKNSKPLPVDSNQTLGARTIKQSEVCHVAKSSRSYDKAVPKQIHSKSSQFLLVQVWLLKKDDISENLVKWIQSDDVSHSAHSSETRFRTDINVNDVLNKTVQASLRQCQLKFIKQLRT
ncbi:hypothetical protein Tco_0746611 [Tanacetum coccineum]